MFKSVMYPAEYEIDLPVATTAIVPGIDDTLVVAEQMEVPFFVRGDVIQDGEDEKLKANAFGPADVTLSIAGLPVWTEGPGLPMPMDNNCNTEG